VWVEANALSSKLKFLRDQMQELTNREADGRLLGLRHECLELIRAVDSADWPSIDPSPLLARVNAFAAELANEAHHRRMKP
jgi:hypothetical protein